MNALYPNHDEFCINSWTTFEALLSLLKESVLRWSDTIKDIKDIDDLINGDRDQAVKNYVYSYLYRPYALIIARLANNLHFEDLAVILSPHNPNGSNNWGKFASTADAAWPKLVQYLRDEVKPLV